jgi:vesicle-associated membrane protein 4
MAFSKQTKSGTRESRFLLLTSLRLNVMLTDYICVIQLSHHNIRYFPPSSFFFSSSTYNKIASALQAQVDATIRTMQETINNLPERKKGLDLFENRTDRLFITSRGSCDKANKVRKRVWWKDIKGRMCLISSVIILLLMIVILLIMSLMLQHHNY